MRERNSDVKVFVPTLQLNYKLPLKFTVSRLGLLRPRYVSETLPLLRLFVEIKKDTR